ncbi:hypothetical protein CEXT_199421 [Caerostris extrusa]|uniref:Uncharacterized protein n=1 Tax=Caerostris extrusa TaxID=172846 RepID=A0AAV4WRE2_CAEEX|nr:hypothetical protein CEXT_199421 [Caerostris extrusa]
MHAPVIMPNTRGCSQNAGCFGGRIIKKGQMAPRREKVFGTGNNGEWPIFRSIPRAGFSNIADCPKEVLSEGL